MMTSLNRNDKWSVVVQKLYDQLLGSYAAEPESTHFASSSLEAFLGSFKELMLHMNSLPSLSLTQTKGSDGFVGSAMLCTPVFCYFQGSPEILLVAA
jgi:hypothetical protein